MSAPATPSAVAPKRRLSFNTLHALRPDPSLEWLVTNGLGGYASGPVAGGLTRRYHGLLIASLPAPLGRMLYMTHLRTLLELDAGTFVVDHEDLKVLEGPGVAALREFRLEAGLPVWTYEAGGVVIERRLVMPRQQNTVLVFFRMITPATRARLRMAPVVHIRPHDAHVTPSLPPPPVIHTTEAGLELEVPGGWPAMRWQVAASDVTMALDAPFVSSVEYALEGLRGYDHAGALWSPGWIEATLANDAPLVFVASTEGWDRLAAAPEAVLEQELQRRTQLVIRANASEDAIAAELAIAADQFLILPSGRAAEVARARAEGEEPRTVIAGYHWFTDWGRDTMISLEGLTLETGRDREGGLILRTFAHYIRNGLIPNLFPEGEHKGLYHTADATLWFLHAIDRYVTRTGQHAIVADLLPSIVDIIEHHLAGTHFGIRVDPADGLLTQGAPHYQLTWMDAKVGDWVVTPRRGKAVEINALWYNALCLASSWLTQAGDTARAATYGQAAERAAASFNRRFWNDERQHLNDVVDGEEGDDPACRPNQVLAVALPHPVLDRTRWTAVLDVVRKMLVTPVGLRSLAPGHPDYQPKYFGDLRARDAAYHQGTVWAWLIGPFIDAWLRVHPEGRAEARGFLAGFVPHLDEACVGSISEVFDAESPFTPRGCIAQAWSVAEVLRAWRRTAARPPMSPT